MSGALYLGGVMTGFHIALCVHLGFRTGLDNVKKELRINLVL